MKEEIIKSSGNLYADLGHKDAEEKEAKAVLAREIYRITMRKKLSQSKAAKMLGVSQPSLSNLLKGKLQGFSTDRLLRLLNQLGRDVDINIRPSRSKRSVGRISVHTYSTSMSCPITAKGRD